MKSVCMGIDGGLGLMKLVIEGDAYLSMYYIPRLLGDGRYAAKRHHSIGPLITADGLLQREGYLE
jgi:hypothetical protein